MFQDVYFQMLRSSWKGQRGHELEMICKCIFNRFDCETCKSLGRSPMLGDDSIGRAFIFKRRAPVAVDRPICLTNNQETHFPLGCTPSLFAAPSQVSPDCEMKEMQKKLAKLGDKDRADSCWRRSSCER